MQFIDTHCHIHDHEYTAKYDKSVAEIVTEAANIGVTRYICVGTSAESSEAAVKFSSNNVGSYASAAIHPHEVAEKDLPSINAGLVRLEKLLQNKNKKLVAIGECGLDYFYHADNKVRQAQKELFKKHLDLAVKYDLPLIFHIRDAFDDFFEILDQYAAKGSKIRGVVHSFSAHIPQLNGCLKRGLYIGLNGIMTFTRDDLQLEAAKAVPLERLLIETDAPFLTPKPFRGTMCELKHVVVTAEFLSILRDESLLNLADSTTTNAITLFCL